MVISKQENCSLNHNDSMNYENSNTSTEARTVRTVENFKNKNTMTDSFYFLQENRFV